MPDEQSAGREIRALAVGLNHLVLGNANPELGDLDPQPRANVPRLGSDAVVHLGSARKGANARDRAFDGVMAATTTGAATADSLWREHVLSP